MSPKHLLLIPFLTLIFLAACSDDDPVAPPPETDTLLTLNLGEYFQEAFAAEGLVFASDQDGNLLDTATWSGPATIVLKNSEVHPDTISFTFIQYNNSELTFATEVGVPVGAVKNFPGYLHTTHTGEANLTFLNAPDCERFRIAQNWDSFSHPGPLEPQRTIQIYGDSTDCYVRVDPMNTTPIGGWLRGIEPGDADTLDFDLPGAVAPLAGTKVQIPAGGDRISCNLYGTVIIGNTRSIIGFDWLAFSDILPESVTLYAPEFDHSKLGAMFYIFTEGSPSVYYIQESTGPVPTAFTKMAGELIVTSTVPDSLAFTTTSTWDRFSTYWTQHHGLYGSWYVDGPRSVQAFALPQIPKDITDMFPDYPRQEFGLQSVEIIQDNTVDMVRTQGQYFSSSGAVNAMHNRGILSPF